MTEHVVTRINDGWYVCDKCGSAGSERWAILHEYPALDLTGTAKRSFR